MYALGLCMRLDLVVDSVMELDLGAKDLMEGLLRPILVKLQDIFAFVAGAAVLVDVVFLLPQAG